MASAVRIGTWDVEYATERVQRRLQPVLARVIESELERALQDAGVGGGERLVIRELELDLRLELTASDAALAQAFSRAIAEQIRAAARPGGSENAVRYPSTSAALFDLVASFARGDHARLWAWQRLELIAGDPRSEDGGVQLVRALCSSPREIVAQLSSLARETALWAGFVRRLPAGALHELAGAALSTLEGTRAALEPGGVAYAEDGAESAAPDPIAQRAATIARRSWIARASVEARLALPADSRAIAVLAIAEADPGGLRGSNAAALALGLRALLEGASGSPGRRGSPDATAPARPQPVVVQDAPNTARPAERPRAGEQPATAHASTRPPNAASSNHGVATEAPGDGASATAMAMDSPRADELAASAPVLPQREEAITRRAGLLFLLHVLADIERVQPFVTQPALAARSTRFTLHALAALLADCGESDPAALAFAGLSPCAEPPSRGEPALEPGEIDGLRALTAAIDARLLERVGSEPTRTEICARDGAVLYEPGWIELRLPLSSVDTRLRRAGLDLHPDFVPWLGAVVRFSYV